MSILYFVLISFLACAAAVSDEMRVFLEAVNPPAVSKHMLSNGDIILCVRVEDQLSIRNTNHTIQMMPSEQYTQEEGSEQWNGQLFNLEVGSCEKNTIPVLYTSEKVANSFATVKEINQKYPSGKHRIPLSSAPADGHEHALNTLDGRRTATHEHGLNWLNGKFTGILTSINLWNPYVEKNTEFSLSQLWLLSNKAGPHNTIEAGWQVYPIFYGGPGPRLFVYWTADGYNKTGCYNLHCKGFVQTSKKYVLGGAVSPVSTAGEAQYEWNFRVFQDSKTGNWWLQINGQNVGYWPPSIFNSLKKGCETIELGGEVAYDKQPGVRHTKTQMGGGKFASAGYKHAAYHRKIQYIDANGKVHDATGMHNRPEAPECYNVGTAVKGNNTWGVYFFYGGPGYNARCNVSRAALETM